MGRKTCKAVVILFLALCSGEQLLAALAPTLIRMPMQTNSRHAQRHSDFPGRPTPVCAVLCRVAGLAVPALGAGGLMRIVANGAAMEAPATSPAMAAVAVPAAPAINAGGLMRIVANGAAMEAPAASPAADATATAAPKPAGGNRKMLL
jgi:hypothetical protein